MNSVNGWSLIGSNELDRSPFPGAVIVPVPGTRQGDVTTVLHFVGSEFNNKVEKLYSPGCWGWNPKQIPGTNVYSNHASGTAIDLNAPSHPWKKRGTFNSNQVARIREILNFLEGAIIWGGDWSDAYVDEMHFEISGNAAHINRIANKIRSGINEMIDPSELRGRLLKDDLGNVVWNPSQASFDKHIKDYSLIENRHMLGWVTRPMLEAYFAAYFNESPNDGDYKYHIGRFPKDVLHDLANSDKRKQYLSRIAADEKALEESKNKISRLEQQLEECQNQVPEPTPPPDSNPEEPPEEHEKPDLTVIEQVLRWLFSLFKRS